MDPQTQRVYAAVKRAGDSIVPRVRRELESTYGPAWLVRVNTRLKAEGKQPGRGLGDPRFVLSLVAHDPALRAFNARQRDAARQLLDMSRSIAHYEPLTASDAERALELTTYLVGRNPERSPGRQRKEARDAERAELDRELRNRRNDVY